MKGTALTVTWITRLCFVGVCLFLVCLGYLLILVGGPDTGTSGAILTGFVAGHAIVKFSVGLAVIGAILEIVFRIGPWLTWF
ncbi:hypothetical protein FHW16_005786 [Phyllobacterium myrsinacearum]|uniref:Uncharacterized protein n=1 Tax=Phyllobacterium myrsinacearum TaxID=28101 RepID=A0A839EV57_9HYPH|nr:hypothetical protein [Phyllobacterium myrsinacearum]